MYRVWDNDNAHEVCFTGSHKEAFTTVLNYLIELKETEFCDPIMIPMNGSCADTQSMIKQAENAYRLITAYIPVG